MTPDSYISLEDVPTSIANITPTKRQKLTGHATSYFLPSFSKEYEGEKITSAADTSERPLFVFHNFFSIISSGFFVHLSQWKAHYSITFY